MNKALFLDRDGVINKRIIGGYVTTPDEFILLDDVLPILKLAHANGYTLILISNQQGVGKGLMTPEQLDVVHDHMQSLLQERVGLSLNAIKVCTSLSSQNDPRRKPAPGMLLESIEEFGLDPRRSWFVGDSLTDAAAGRAAGVLTALVGDHPSGSADLQAPNLAILYDLLSPFLTPH